MHTYTNLENKRAFKYHNLLHITFIQVLHFCWFFIAVLASDGVEYQSHSCAEDHDGIPHWHQSQQTNDHITSHNVGTQKAVVSGSECMNLHRWSSQGYEELHNSHQAKKYNERRRGPGGDAEPKHPSTKYYNVNKNLTAPEEVVCNLGNIFNSIYVLNITPGLQLDTQEEKESTQDQEKYSWYKKRPFPKRAIPQTCYGCSEQKWA